MRGEVLEIRQKNLAETPSNSNSSGVVVVVKINDNMITISY